MVDALLMSSLLRALPPSASLLLVGEVDHLPSVGPGMVLRNIIDSGVVPVVRLTEVLRQAVVGAGQRANAGYVPGARAVRAPGRPADHAVAARDVRVFHLSAGGVFTNLGRSAAIV